MTRLEKIEDRLAYIEAQLGIGDFMELAAEAPVVKEATPDYPTIDEFRGQHRPEEWTPGFKPWGLGLGPAPVNKAAPWEVAPQHRPERFTLQYQDVDNTK